MALRSSWVRGEYATFTPSIQSNSFPIELPGFLSLSLSSFSLPLMEDGEVMIGELGGRIRVGV